MLLVASVSAVACKGGEGCNRWPREGDTTMGEGAPTVLVDETCLA